MTARLGWTALLLAAGAAQLARGWAGWLPAVVMVAAAVLPLGLVTLAGWLRLPVGLTVASVLGLAALGSYVAAAPTGAGLFAVLRDAVPRLLTAPRPAPATPDLLMPGALLAVLVGLWVGLRTCRAGQALLAAPIGAAVLYTSAQLLSAGDADRHGLAAAALLAFSVAGWVLLDRPWRDRAGGRAGRTIAPVAPVAPAITAVAFCAGLALFAGALPLHAAFEPRQLIDPPSRVLAEPSPLPRLAAWAQQADVELLRVSGEPQVLRLVALSEFTGASWRASGTYRPSGSAGEPDLPYGQRRGSAEVEVRVMGLDGPWLPTVGTTPTEMSLADVSTDPDSGSTALAGGLRAGLRYRTRGELDAARADEVIGAAVPSDGAAERYLRVPHLPFEFADYARLATTGASTPYEQAVALEFAVRAGRRFDPGAPSGSSYARLSTFLFGAPGEAGAMAGTSEQFAAAFAVLGRAVGLPTRIVVGFLPGERADDGTRVVRGRHAVARPEVYFSGWGWMSFDPAPQGAADASAAAKQQVRDRVVRRSTGLAPPQSPRSPEDRPAARPVAVGDAPSGPFLRVGTGWLLAGGGAALLVPPLLLVLARASRRGRHRRGGARGAWSEVLDLLVLHGRPAPRGQPAPELAVWLARSVPMPAPAMVPAMARAHPAVRLAALADHAAFAPDPPVRDREVWADVRRLRRALRRATPWHRRLLWPFDPRPLRRRPSHGTGRGHRAATPG